jgi:hypothetical protein
MKPIFLVVVALLAGCAETYSVRYKPGKLRPLEAPPKASVFVEEFDDQTAGVDISFVTRHSVRAERNALSARGGNRAAVKPNLAALLGREVAAELKRVGVAVAATREAADLVLKAAIKSMTMEEIDAGSALITQRATILVDAALAGRDGAAARREEIAAVGTSSRLGLISTTRGMAFNAAVADLVPKFRVLFEPKRAEAAAGVAAASVPEVDEVERLPAARAPSAKRHAIVIGVERYREALPKADFAAGDAKLAAEYFKRVLGVPEANLALLTDDRATKSDFEKHFERWLPNRVEKDDEVFVYFSGHGAPNPAKGDAYLVPFDGDPTYIEQTGYPLKRMYEQLAKLPAKRVLVAMDSCFSGAGGRSVIAKGARPLVSVQSAEVPGALSVISASAGDQVSNSYQEKKHGLFTYYLLLGLKEKGDDFRAVYDHLKPEVSRVARREYNADQDPQWREGR